MPIQKALQLILAAFLVAIGFYGGYELGSWDITKAKQSLANYKEASEATRASLTKMVSDLRQSSINSEVEYQASIAKSNSEYLKLQDKWAKDLRNKDTEIKTLKGRVSTSESQISVLEKLLASSSPEEKAALQAALDKAKSDLANMQERIEGLKCMDVKIPVEFTGEIGADRGN
jgi:septal ring factor EnvC (AmiA/AmiB activator)